MILQIKFLEEEAGGIRGVYKLQARFFVKKQKLSEVLEKLGSSLVKSTKN